MSLFTKGFPIVALQSTAVFRLNTLKDRGTRWAVVVGVSEYANLPPAAQLQFAHRDAEDFSAFLRTAAGGALPASHIRLLTNQKATLAAVRAALHTWLVDTAAPDDIVYIFFAGHGVVAERDEAYFVAHDSDPQNLHSTGLSFREVDNTLSKRLRASQVIMVADACHSGQLGWSTYSPNSPSLAAGPMALIGQGDRSFLRLLASSASERSYEDTRWGGGHGIFTHALLEGLGGKAQRNTQGSAQGNPIQPIRASDVIDYVAKLVPAQTAGKQHPRVAGNFDASLALAASAPVPVRQPIQAASLDVTGPPGTSVYLNNVFRGKIRPEGTLRIEALGVNPNRISVDLPDGTVSAGTLNFATGSNKLNISPDADRLGQLQVNLQKSNGLDVWDAYNNEPFPASQRAAAADAVGRALEELGQACVNDYVQSTVSGPKKLMLQRSVEAYQRLQVLRPNDPDIETRKIFCQGRLQIASGQFAAAAASLQESLRRDPKFACAQNALGVALDRLNRKEEAMQAFEAASKLTPEWGLPPFQIASQLVAAGRLREARPYFENSVRYNPRSVVAHWNLLRVNRLLGSMVDAERVGLALLKLNPSYAPAYTELGLVYEASGNPLKAAEAYDSYLLLAPNFVDSDQVKARAERLRARPAPRQIPTLKKK